MRGRKVWKGNWFSTSNQPKRQPLDNSPDLPDQLDQTIAAEDAVPEDAVRYRRLAKDEYDMVVDSDGIARDPEGRPTATSFLRPRPETKTYLDGLLISATEMDETLFSKEDVRLWGPFQVQEMFQECYSAHRAQSHMCEGTLVFDKSKEQKVGLCWKEAVKCTTCSYSSDTYKLYSEVKSSTRGRKAARPNRAVAVGMTHTPAGNAAVVNLMQSLNCPAPSYTNLQHHSNVVGEHISKLNQDDLKKRRRELSDINAKKGLQADHPHSISGDGRFNNPLYTAPGNTPLQPATQATYSFIENTTGKHQIVNIENYNKLCQAGSLHRRKAGKKIKCPDHPGTCTATMDKMDSIGDERRMTRAGLSKLKEDNVNVGYLVTDGDSRAGASLHEVFGSGEHMRDPMHISRSQRTHAKTAKFSAGMFGMDVSSAKRKKLQGYLAEDVKQRCNAEFNTAIVTHRSDPDKFSTAMTNASAAIVKCLQGQHSLCNKYSFICKKKKTYKNKFLPANVSLLCNEADEDTLARIIAMRLGPKIVFKTRLGYNTQHPESYNRYFNLRNPKHITWTRNFTSRINSATHQINNSPSVSLALQSKAIGNQLSREVAVQLKAKEIRRRYMKIYKASLKHKTNRCANRMDRYRTYQAKHNLDDNKAKDYSKNIMDT